MREAIFIIAISVGVGACAGTARAEAPNAHELRIPYSECVAKSAPLEAKQKESETALVVLSAVTGALAFLYLDKRATRHD